MQVRMYVYEHARKHVCTGLPPYLSFRIFVVPDVCRVVAWVPHSMCTEFA